MEMVIFQSQINDITNYTQRANEVKMASHQHRCDVMTSHRRRYDIILTPNARWVDLLKLEIDVNSDYFIYDITGLISVISQTLLYRIFGSQN